MNELEVLINGVRYVPTTEFFSQSGVKPIQKSISVWWMNDNHTFKRIYGITLDAIAETADIYAKTVCRDGMLCSVNVIYNGVIVRTVGDCIHAKNGKLDRDQLLKWVKQLCDDEEVMELLKRNINPVL